MIFQENRWRNLLIDSLNKGNMKLYLKEKD